MRATTATATWKPRSRQLLSAACDALSAVSGVRTLTLKVPSAACAAKAARPDSARSARFMQVIMPHGGNTAAVLVAFALARHGRAVADPGSGRTHACAAHAGIARRRRDARRRLPAPRHASEPPVAGRA